MVTVEKLESTPNPKKGKTTYTSTPRSCWYYFVTYPSSHLCEVFFFTKKKEIKLYVESLT